MRYFYFLSGFRKVVFALLAGFFLTTHFAKASHAIGADVTYQCLGPNQYLVTLTFFRDCDGVFPLSSYTLNYSSAACGVSSSITLNQVGSAVDITPLCPSVTSVCSGGSFSYGVEQYTFQGILNLPAGACGTNWVLSWTECCRNYAITTLNGPGNQNMYVTANLNNTLVPCNNSPVFNNPPASIVCVNQPVNYNHGVTDADGDSLVFSLANCMQGSGNNVVYNGGYSGANPLSTVSGVTINSQTGAITFTPNAVQIGVICVRVEEYRNGVKIGEVIRDMQFNVINCTNQAPTATGINGTGVYTTSTCVGSQVCFTINTADANGNNITMSWNSGIPGGLMSFNNNGGLSPTANFCWTPTAADVGFNFFTFTVEDNACPIAGVNTYTYTIEVYPTANTINAGVDVSICPGGSTNLLATSSGATSYTWSPAAGLSCTNCANPVASPGSTTVYTVTGNFADGCSLSDAVTVTVNPLPTVNVTPSVAYTCPGNSVLLTASGTGISTYAWSSGGAASTTTVSPASTTVYTVTVTSAQGCQATATATVNVNTPNPNVCNVIYASPTGSGTGTQASPASLSNAINMAGCSGAVIKMAIGTYTITNPINNIAGNLTLEGGFDPALSWRKTSQAGATVILRSNVNLEGAANQERLVAIYMNGATNVRFQDLTIQTANVTSSGASTYGVHMTNCSNYTFTRTQVLPGAAATGAIGAAGTNGNSATNGSNGTTGDIDDEGAAGYGGAGGAGAGAGAGGGGAGGPDPTGNANCGCFAGTTGSAGGAATQYRAGGGGGGGGSGGEESSNGGGGGNGGANFGGTAQTGGGAAGPWGDPGGAGTNGSVGASGLAGGGGAAGAAGTHTAGFWVPGSQASTGADGQGGKGGRGGGGGGGQYCTFCDDGAGNGAGGGGGGGQGGTGGTGGRGGGSSFGVYLYNCGAGGNFLQSRLVAGAAGAGGSGGTGGLGGSGGTGGIGSATGTSEIGRGGNGGNGGIGGGGGVGGAGQPGQSIALHQNGGSAPVTSVINFNLPAQPTIFVSNVSCTNTDVTYTAAVSAAWNLGAGATNPTPSGTSVVTQYTTTGRKDIVYAADTYTGFANIILGSGVNPQMGTNAPLISGVYRVCAGSAVSFSSLNPGLNYIYSWNLGGGAVPNTYSGTTFQNLNNIVFNTPGSYVISLQYTTDCCGLSNPVTITLVVDPQPATAVAGSGPICAGTTTPLTLTASGANTYTWAPSSGLSATTGTSVSALPTSTTTYTIVGSNAPGTCFSTTTATVTVNDITLTPNPTTATCGANGSAGVTVAGGSGSYTYDWTPLPQTTNPVAGLPPGTYYVVVTDAVTGCEDSSAVVVPAGPGLITVTLSNSTPVSCFGGGNGTATITVTGGTGGPYSYNWSPVGGSGIIASSGGTGTTVPIAAGTYSVVVVDMGNPACPSGTAVTIAEPSDLLLAFVDTTSSTCINSTDGDATVNASGGTGPYVYTWNTVPVQNGSYASGLTSGSYTVTVTDQNGCNEVLTLDIDPITPCVLPVEYLYFTAEPATDFIHLKWQTTHEDHNLGFEVERGVSPNSFERIGWVAADPAGQNGASYQFPDEEALPGVNYFYRLRQIDQNGNTNYSEVRQAMLPLEGGLEVLNVYPSPVEDKVYIEINLPEGGNLLIPVLNMLGQETGISKTWKLDAGVHTLEMDLGELSGGMYIGKLMLNGSVSGTLRLTKAD